MYSTEASYLDPNLLLLISLLDVGLENTYTGEVRLNISDYVLLSNWLSITVNSEINDKLVDRVSSRNSSLAFVLASMLNCKETYILLHTDFYYFNNTRIYFNDFQELRLRLQQIR